MTLRSHLVALVVVALLPLLAFAVFLMALFAAHERESTDEGLRAAARGLAVSVDNLMEDSVSTLRALATSEHLDTGNLAAFHRMAARVLPSQYGWRRLELLTPDGAVVLDAARPLGTRPAGVPLATQRWLRQAVDMRAPVVSDLVDEGTGARHVVVVVPVTRRERVSHALAAVLDRAVLDAVLASQRVPADATSAVVDRAGIVLARSRGGDRHVGTSATADYLALVREGQEGSARAASLDGVDTLTAFARTRVAGWTVALARPAAAVDAPVRRFLWALAGGGAVFLLAGVTLAALMGRRLAEPIVALATFARRSAGTGALPPARRAAVDEVHTLTEAIGRAERERAGIEEERARLLEREQAARRAAEEAERRAAFLAEASAVMAAALDYEGTLQSLADLAVPTLADLCIIDALGDDGALTRVAAAHVDPAKLPLVRELQQRYPPRPDGPHPVARALRSGRPQIAASLAEDELAAMLPDPGHRELARSLDYRSYLVVPLVARGRTLGAISFVASSPGRRYTEADVPFAEDLARRAAVAIDNARLFRQSEARQRAAQALAEVGRFLGQALDPGVVGERIAGSVRSLLGARTAIFYSVDAEARMTVVAAAGEVAPGFSPGAVLPAGTATVGLAVRERAAVFTGDVLTDARLTVDGEWRARLERAPYRSVLAVPLLIHGRVIGVLALGDRAGRVYDAEDRLLVQGVADQAALALENARLYAEAREANTAKDDFLATLSHELRTPLTAMVGWIRMLQSGRLDAAGAARALEVIDRNTRLQAQLIDDLLDISRIITGKLALEAKPVDLVGVIEAAVESVGPAAGARGLTLGARLDPGVGPVFGDPRRLQQVVWNLLTNAIKFTPSGGRVEVTLEREEPYACIRVSDTGRGISADFLPHVFDRFRQADSTSTRSHGGLGVGLAIVRHLVELHQGHVHAESAGEGRGATFVVRLPLAPTTPREAAPPRVLEAGERAPSLRGVHVLVVDDEPDARDLLTEVLQQSGAQVTPAASAREALAAMGRVRPNVLISDIAMPDVDGYELMRAVRALDADGAAMPAVALTAYARAEDEARALAAGFSLHVPKPVEPVALIRTVARLAGRDGH